MRARRRGQVKGVVFFCSDRKFIVDERPRLGIAVSKKVSKHAVHRNRIKRIIRESFRLNSSNLRPMDIVIVAQPASATMKNDELFNVLRTVWAQFQTVSESTNL